MRMRCAVFPLFVALGLWLLQAEAVTRDDFLMQTTQVWWTCVR
jgi:hypothetical protein